MYRGVNGHNQSSIGHRVLVTGAAGFIGSHLVERLLSKGYEVICLDSFDNYYSDSFKKANISEAGFEGRVCFRQADIRNQVLLRRLLKEHNIDTVVHLAARPGVRLSLKDPVPYMQINVEGTLSVLEACRHTGIRRLIFASSSSVYGDNNGQPAVEEKTPTRPLSPYGASKVAGEALCYTYSTLCDMAIVALRFFTVYGPRQRPDMAIHKFTQLIDKGEEVPVLGDGLSKRDFTYIYDIIGGIQACLERPLKGYEVFNLGGAKPVELINVIDLIAHNLGKSARLLFLNAQPGEPTVTFANVEKAKRLLGFSPTIGIEEGIEKFVEWYRERHDAPVGLT